MRVLGNAPTPVVADGSQIRRIPYSNASHAIIATHVDTTAKLPDIDRRLLPKVATVELCVTELARTHAETDSQLASGHYNFPATLISPPKITALRTNAIGVNALLSSSQSAGDNNNAGMWSHLESLAIVPRGLTCAMATLVEFISSDGDLYPCLDTGKHQGRSEFWHIRRGTTTV